MLGMKLTVVFLSSLQVLYAQGQPPPAKCRGPPPDLMKPMACCDIPQLFTAAELSACGIEPGSKINFEDCSKETCVMKNANLLDSVDETKIDRSAVIAYIDNWAEKNPTFKNASDKAKEHCVKPILPGPPHLCEPDRFIVCYAHMLLDYCPNWHDTENCKKLREDMDECRQYFRH